MSSKTYAKRAATFTVSPERAVMPASEGQCNQISRLLRLKAISDSAENKIVNALDTELTFGSADKIIKYLASKPNRTTAENRTLGVAVAEKVMAEQIRRVDGGYFVPNACLKSLGKVAVKRIAG